MGFVRDPILGASVWYSSRVQKLDNGKLRRDGSLPWKIRQDGKTVASCSEREIAEELANFSMSESHTDRALTVHGPENEESKIGWTHFALNKEFSAQ